MEKSEQFSDYLFAKMGPPHSTTVNGSELPPKTTERCEAPRELKGYRKWLSENLMLLVTLSGVMLGVILGFSLRPLHLHEDSIMLISYPGELFMRVLKLMILPLVISSLIAGSASLNARMNGKIALRTLVYFASTSLLNAALGIALVMLIHPGDPDLHNTTDRSTDKRAVNLLDSLLDLGRNVFPDNLFQASFQQAHTVYLPKPSITNTFNETVNDTALIGNGAGGSGGGGSGDGINDSTDDMVEEEPQLIRVIQYRSGTNTLGIVFFCLVFGTFLGTIGQKGQVVVDFFAAIFEVVMKMVTCVMWLTPVGISSVIAGKILSVNDLHLVMAQLMWFILTVAVGVVLYQLVIMQAIYYVFVRRNPFKFYAGLIQAMLTAFATASTAAALPVTFRCMNDKLRVDQRITRFVLPIGCNVNMDGTALFISIASIFIAQMSGMTLGFGELVTVLLTSTAASMSSASVPSAALVLLLVVLTAIDAPVQDVTLLFAVDWFVDRIRTTNNMLGDCYTAAVVEELSRKELMALDAAVLYQEIPISTPNGHVSLEGQTELDSNCTIPDAVIVDMNVVINKVHQQQQQQQQQQYSIVPPPPSSTCITTTMASSLNSSGEYVNVPTSYVTIGMMPPPSQAAPTPTSMAMAVGAGQNISSTGSSTSTFKTPLLPMPTLEDIEVGLCNSSSNSNMPPGILKYTTTATTSLNMPPPPALGMGPGPPNLNQMSSMSSPPQTTPPSVLNLPALVSQQHNMSVVTPPPPPSNNLSLGSNSTMGDGSSTCGTLKSSAKLQQQQQQTPANLNSTTTSNIAAGTIASVVANNCNNININNTTSNSSSTVPLNLHSTTANSSKTSSRSNLHNRPASPKCCSCFGGGGSSSTNNHTRGRNTNKSSSSISTKSQGYGQTKGRRHSRHNAQTFWSAVLTNLGICALLLAYTLLGSFIFLTIESEDSAYLQQQRTLASTKRNIQPHKQHTGTTGSGVAGSGSSSSSSISGSANGAALAGTTNNNIYQTQQQQQQQHTPPLHYDNATINAPATSSSSTSASSPQMMEGMISLQNNDFSYGDDFTPQYALSPDTYDVRQRTIENIWDITVSLNILYKENWTKLAALEIAKFQDQLIKRLNEDALLQLPHEADVNGQTPATEAVLLFHQHGLTPHHAHHHHHEWNFARAFLYSLTVLTTIGYGNIAPRTTLGRLVTLAYAFFGIPLTLVYLSSTGGILAKVAREVFSKALCCCLCSNCGYCCYDEKRMAEKERRMKRKRQQEELRKQQQAMQEPYYVRSGSMPDNFQTPEKQSLGNNSIQMPDLDSLSASESRGSMHGLAILAPILLCFSMMIIYILFGAVVLYRLEEWPLLDGIYFCFMSLSTIGFGDMMPGFRHDSNTTIWFCSIYIMSGMALTAMCFNVIHEEIVNRIKIVVEFKKSTALDTTNEEANYYMPP